jgi:hypothetical protein
LTQPQDPADVEISILKDFSPWGNLIPPTLATASTSTATAFSSAPLNTSVQAPPEICLMSAEAFIALIESDEVIIHRSLVIHPSHDRPASLPLKQRFSNKEALDHYVPTDYHNFADVYSEDVACTLPPYHKYDRKIELEEGAKPP